MSSLSTLVKLVLAHNFKNWGRALIALLGIAVSVSLVVWNLRGFGITRSQMAEAAKQSGRFDVAVTPKDFRGVQLDPAIVEAIHQDADTAELDVAVKSRVRVLKPEPPSMPGPFGRGGPSGGMTVIGTGAKEPPQGLEAGRWLGPGANEAVISGSCRDRYKLKMGDELVIAGMGAELTLKVVGVVSSGRGAPVPGMRRMPPPHLADAYVSPATAGTLNGYTDRPSLLCIVLKDPEAAEDFSDRWTDKLASASPAASLRLLKTSDDPMGMPSSEMQQMLFANATVLAFLAAIFIVFVTLSVSVRERMRQFAIFRALALSRIQLVFMVVVEAFLFATLGWAVGTVLIKGFLLLGHALSGSLAMFRSSAFSDRPIGMTVIGISLGCALLGALAAAVLPAWQASRIRPLDLLSSQGRGGTRSFPYAMVVIGLILVVVNPLLVVLAIGSPSIRSALSNFWGWGASGFAAPLAGSLAMIVGFGLVTPLAVLLAERLFGPILAWMLRLDRRFLRQQLSGNLWRTSGTTIALSVGLALFVTSLVWGYSMLVPFTPDKGLPRMQVAIMPAGVPESAIADVKATPGVKADECMAMVVEQPRLTKEMLTSPAFAGVEQKIEFVAQKHMLFMGVDPERVFGGDNPLFRLQFVEGDAASAAKKLAEGRYCVVPDHFSTQTGLKVGDSFSVEVPNAPGKEVRYTIAGVASVPGWNWLTKFSEVRQRAIRALAIVFVSYEHAKTDFAIDRIKHFWMNVDDGVTAEELERRLEPIARRNAGVRVNVPQVGETAVGAQYVKATDRENVIAMVGRRGNDVIWSLTWLPLITLAISSLAVFNAILASIRARFWQIGVLRGVGLTRGQLLRLILGESLLICAAASMLSLISGVGLAWCGTRLCTLFFFFGGRTPPLTVPWIDLSLGFGIAFGLCLLAGLIPACVAAAKEPLKFIQAGRLSV